MSDSTIALAHAFVAAINRHDVETIATLMTREHRFTDSPGNVFAGREAMRAGWTAHFRAVPDYTLAVEEIYSQGSHYRHKLTESPIISWPELWVSEGPAG